MDGIDWASSAMAAARTRLEIAAANLSNVSTDGFRGALARGTLTSRGVRIDREANNAYGALRHTGRAFDLAIVGDGAFRIREMDGAIRFTRAGSFTRERDGTLHTDSGACLLGAHGPIRVSETGTVGARELGLPPHSSVRAGFIETANVDAIGEMLHVMEAQRSFETAQRVLAAIDGTRQKAANDVARIK